MEEGMFSAHVRARLDGTFDDSQKILEHLYRVVRRQLQKVGQWNLSPKYLGYDGESWERSEAIDDLVQDVYMTCIEKRLVKLGEHLKASGTCEGSVIRKLKWFLSDRQEKGNPIARRVFRNVRSASESLVENATATTTCTEKLTGKSIILANGQKSAVAADELETFFFAELEDPDFTGVIHRESLASWQKIEAVLADKFAHGLSGYKITDLAKSFSDACKRPGVVSESESPLENGENSIFILFENTRTATPEARYQERDDLDAMITAFKSHAEQTIAKSRIRSRVLEMLDKLAAMIVEGEDVRQLSVRKLADALGMSKSTLAEDIARLQTYQSPPEA